MEPNEPQVSPDRVAVPNTTSSSDPALLRTGAIAAGAGLVLLLALDTLRGEALLAVALLGALAGSVAWTITWVIDQQHLRAARIALLTTGVTTAAATVLGGLATELGSAVVPLVGVFTVATSVLVGIRTVQSHRRHGATDA